MDSQSAIRRFKPEQRRLEIKGLCRELRFGAPDSGEHSNVTLCVVPFWMAIELFLDNNTAALANSHIRHMDKAEFC